jgi:hypothetical protein
MILEFLIIYWTSILIPAAMGAFFFKRLELEMKLLFALIAIALIVELATYFLAISGHNTNWVHNIYLLIEILTFGFIFSQWQDSRSTGNWVFGVALVAVSLHIISILFFLSISEMNSHMMTLSCIFYSAICALTLYSLQKKDTGSIYRNYVFWVSSALLIYSAGSLSFFAFNKILLSVVVWHLHIIVNIVAYCLYSVGLLCHIRR